MKGHRILIVEDEFLVALEIASVLADAGFEVLEPAGTIEGALRAIGSEAIDGVILDCNLSGRDVTEIADSLTARHIPFVFLTGYGRESLPPTFRDLPLISKPFDEKHLVASVRAMLLRSGLPASS